MSDYVPPSNAAKPDSISLVDTTTRVLGGVDGPTNLPIKQLADWCQNLETTVDNITLEVPNATHSTRGIVLLATPADADNDEYDDRAVTPAGLVQALASLSTTIPPASTTTAGIVKLASLAETATGTNTTKAVTPAGLKAVNDLQAPLASPVFTGTPTAPTPPIGTNNTRLATTAFVAENTLTEEDVNALIAAAGSHLFAGIGYQVFPSGLIIQWGRNTFSSGNGTVLFPVAFPTATGIVVLTPQGAEPEAPLWITSDLSSRSGFVWASTNYLNHSACWIAIGY